MGIMHCCRDRFKNNEDNSNQYIININPKGIYHSNAITSPPDKEYYLSISISEMNIFSKQLDYFGLIFEPYIILTCLDMQEIITLSKNNHLMTISNLSEGDGDNEDNTLLNGSPSSSLLSNNMKHKDSFIEIHNDNNLIFTFDWNKINKVIQSDLYSCISIKVYNSFWAGNAFTVKDNEKMTVIIGEVNIPLNEFISKQNYNDDKGVIEKKIFEGNAKIIHRNINHLGNINLCIELNNNEIKNSHQPNNNNNNLIDYLSNETEEGNNHLDINYPYEDIPNHFYYYLDNDDFKKHNKITIEMIIQAELFIEEITSIKPPNLTNLFSDMKNKYCKDSIINPLIIYEVILIIIKEARNKRNVNEMNSLIINMKNDLKLLITTISIKGYFGGIIIKAITFALYWIVIANQEKKNYTTEHKGFYVIGFDMIMILLGRIKDIMNNEDIELYEDNTIIIDCFNNLIAQVNMSHKINQTDQMHHYSIQVAILILANHFDLLYSIANRKYYNSQIAFSYVKLLKTIIKLIKANTNNNQPIHQLSLESIIEIIIKRNDTNDFRSVMDLLFIFLKHYYHYPALLSNILFILATITDKGKTEHNISIYHTINISTLSHYFSIYRCKFKTVSNVLNRLYYKYIYNISSSINKTSHQEHIEIMTVLCNEALLFYAKAKISSLYYDKTTSLIYIRYLLVSILKNCIHIPLLMNDIIGSFFIEDCLSFIDQVSERISPAGRDYISEGIMKNEMIFNESEIKDIFKGIIELSLSIIHFILSSKESDTSPKEQLIIIMKRTSSNMPESFYDKYNTIEQDLLIYLKTQGIDVNKIGSYFNEIKALFD